MTYIYIVSSVALNSTPTNQRLEYESSPRHINGGVPVASTRSDMLDSWSTDLRNCHNIDSTPPVV